MGKRLDAIAVSYANHVCKDRFPDGDDIIKAFKDGIKFANDNRWHFEPPKEREIGVGYVGLFLLAPMKFEVKMVDYEDIPRLMQDDMLGWADIDSLIPYNEFKRANRKHFEND